MLIAEVICAFNTQPMSDRTKTKTGRTKCNDCTKRKTQELAISPI
ncbi:hypothetical protein NC652_041206 [Populus alba x Populus x berolinensis]|nr:hypothetical protein NC652_041206 [Populus alba x Populus x berolinensis]